MSAVSQATILSLGDRDFHQTIRASDKPVLVDFWAPWCGPCRAMTPLIEQIAEEHGDRIAVAKVNLDDSPNLAAELGISSIPTFIRFENGRVTGSLVGSVPKDRLLALALEGGAA